MLLIHTKGGKADSVKEEKKGKNLKTSRQR